MTKAIHRRPPVAAEQLTELFSNTNVSTRLQQIYASRQLRSASELERSLAGLLRPQQLKGLDTAVALLVTAMTERQRILIVGDFDCDGATSSALAVLALRAMGVADVSYLVPNRFEFGYGLTPEIVEVAKGFTPDLIVTVDNGISSIEGVATAKAAGIKVLVTDHHLPGSELPAADAIVNPNQHGCDFPSKNLAGVGVIFYLMSALRSALRERNWFSEQGAGGQTRAEPNMANYLDLVALGTVADVVPLDANNRILVQQGLQRIRAGQARPGILAMLEVAGRQPQRLVASDLGFSIGPRLNAAGRLDDISLGIECLLTDAPETARKIASELDDLNKDRRAIEGGMQQEAIKDLQSLELSEGDDMPWGLCLFNPDWHQGVIGILASRIKDKYHRPVIAFARADKTVDGEAEIKGSARSVPGLHIRDALDLVAKQNPGLLSKFGGHAMAAGMSFKETDFRRFQQAFDRVVRETMPPEALQAQVLSDGELLAHEFTLPLAHELREAGPWGQMFPEPLFDGEFYLVQQRIVGEKHLKLTLAVDEARQQLVDAIAFNVDVSIWPNNACEKVRLAYKLDVNEFRGRQSLQLMVDFIEAI